MKIFGWKSTGRGFPRPAQTRAQSARGQTARGSGSHVALTRSLSGFVSGEWPRSYEQQVRDGYLNNAIAQRAVRMVAEGVASAPLNARDDADNIRAKQALALIRATSAGQSLIETVASHILLHGNAYIEMLPGADGAPVELYALRPERVTIEADARGWPVAFVYRAGQAAMRLPCDTVIHIRSHHPLDDHYGLGCLGAASGAVAVHNAAAKWNKALLDNAARPSGALVYETADNIGLSTEQFDRLKGELEASFQGAGNAGRPMLLEGGLKWQALSLSPADMDFVALKASAARDIALAFGVPPMLLGLPGDATYANYREANKALWRHAILPLAGKILDALSQGLRPWFDDLSVTVDTDQVTALSEDRERLWAQVGAADFLTLEEKREAVGLAAAPDKSSATAKVEQNKTGILELKFNPWHDTADGRFSREGQGAHYGGGGASGSWDKPPPKNNKRGAFGGGGVSGSWNKPKVQGGGGRFGGAGATGSWGDPKPKGGGGSFGGGGASGSWEDNKPVKPIPKIRPLKREIVKPAISSAVTVRPKASLTVRKITAGGYNFEADALDRTVRASGQLRLQPSQPRSRSSQRNAGKPDRLPKDHGGHFIAREFGGPKTRYNHFAQNARFNISEYRSLENEWKKELKLGRKVTVDIRASYNGGSKRPTEIIVRNKINGQRRIRTFPNSK